MQTLAILHLIVVILLAAILVLRKPQAGTKGNQGDKGDKGDKGDQGDKDDPGPSVIPEQAEMVKLLKDGVLRHRVPKGSRHHLHANEFGLTVEGEEAKDA